MKKLIPVLLSLIIITSLAGCSSGNVSNASSSKETTANETAEKSTEKLSDIENDSYIIYTLSYNEALNPDEASSKAITTTKTGNQTYYKFVDLVLSCGTYMNGEIQENTKDNIKTITGSFKVTKNPYEINDLKISITIDTDTDKKTGYITANGQSVDINSNFTSIN